MVGIHFITLIIFNILPKIKIRHAHIDSGSYRELRPHGAKGAGTFGERMGACGLKGAKSKKGINRGADEARDSCVSSKKRSCF